MRIAPQGLQPALRRRAASSPRRLADRRARPDRRSASSLFPLLGGEFMPKLEEGNFWIRATLPTSISLDAVRQVRRRDAAHPPRLPRRRPSPCTDANRSTRRSSPWSRSSGAPTTAPTSPASTTSSSSRRSSPFDEWPRGLTKDEAHRGDQRRAARGVPRRGLQLLAVHPRQRRGGAVRREGRELGQGLRPRPRRRTRRTPRPSWTSCRQVDGRQGPRHVPARSASRTSRSSRTARPARATGSTPATSTRWSRRPSAGRPSTQVYEGEKCFDLTVRWQEPYRSRVEAIREITVATPDGAQRPARPDRDITMEDGPAIIYREDGARYAPVKFSVRGRDLAGTIAERAGQDRREKVAPALRHAPRVGRRDQRAERGRWPAEDDHPDDAPAHRLPHLQRGEELARHAHRAHRHPGGMHGRRARAAGHRHPLLGVGGDGLHLDLRHRHPGRHPGRDVLPAAPRRRAALHRARRARGGREAVPPGAHDDAGGDARPASRRRSRTASARRRRSRWPIVVIGGSLILAIVDARCCSRRSCTSRTRGSRSDAPLPRSTRSSAAPSGRRRCRSSEPVRRRETFDASGTVRSWCRLGPC